METFQPLPAVQRWWWSSERARRPGFTPWAARENQPTQEELDRELEEIEIELEREAETARGQAGDEGGDDVDEGGDDVDEGGVM